GARNPADVAGPPAKQGRRAPRVAAPGVREADRDLGEAAPEFPIGPGNGLPGRFEYLVGMKRSALGPPGAAAAAAEITRSSGMRGPSGAAERGSGRPSSSRGRALRARPAV